MKQQTKQVHIGSDFDDLLLAEYQIWLSCRYFSQAAPVLALFFPVPCI